MKKWIGLLAAGIIFGQGSLSVFSAGYDHVHRIDGKTGKIICYYNTTPVDRYIPPPEAYIRKLKSGQENGGATFKFQLIGAPSSFAESAAEFAGEVWGSLIYSPVPINVQIEFIDYEEEGVLAGAYSTAIYRLDNNGYLPERLYPVALAEKFFQRNLNGTEPDIIIEVNKNVDWYYLTDGETPQYEYDFASVMIHELAHGLGFRGHFRVDDEEVGYGSTPPGAFDGFFENNQNQRLADKSIFPDPSAELGQALTTPPVYYVSPIISREIPEENPGPKMYIPNPWAPGNSLYHLDSYYEFKNGGRDALMTFSTSPSNPIHDPGPLTTYMLYENGWVHTFFVHDTLKDRESLEDPFTVRAEITGDEGIKSNTQYLFYSFNGSQTFDSVAMTPTVNPDEFSADIPVGGLNTTVHYFIKTQDSYGRMYTMPANAPENFYRFYVGADNTPPEIEHKPIPYMLTSNDSLEVMAQISDNLGLDLTRVEYRINDVDQTPFDLEFDTLIDYRGYFVFSVGQVQAGDVIKYRIKATDASVAQNTSYHPESGYHEFVAEDVPPFANIYYTDFESGLDDFLVDGFYHDKPDGFSSYAMHTEHPYPAPNRDDSELELKAQLKIPILINPGDMFMRFDEIAYIEDGETGSQWTGEPESDFYDYVIVEGSKDGGNNWHNFIMGWDCRYWKVWADHFMANDPPPGSGLYVNTAVPDESAMRSHLVNLRAAPEFDDNDTILIRFRLYSDPYLSGWGWVVDNLDIGPLIVPVEEYSMIPESVELYPNPTNGMLNLSMQFHEEVDILEISLLDMVGREILTEFYPDPGYSFRQYFDLNELPNGIYLMKLTSGNQSIMKKIILAR